MAVSNLECADLSALQLRREGQLLQTRGPEQLTVGLLLRNPPLTVRSFAQRRVLEQPEAIARLLSNVLRNDAVQLIFPGSVLIDEAIRSRFVSLMLYLEDLLQKLSDHLVILVVMDPE